MTTKQLAIQHNTSRVVKSKSGNKIFVKMMINETLTSRFTLLDMFEHIGEAKLFNFIITKSMKNDGNFFYQNDIVTTEFCDKYKLSKPTMHVYLRALVQKGVVFKKTKGLYTVNPKYIEFYEEK